MEKTKRTKAIKKAMQKRQKNVQEYKFNYTKEEVLRELARFELKGNIIDQGWFAHLKNDKGLVQSNAIIILSEIVYWYRPTLVFDEETGDIIGLKAKFKGDMLQKSYNQLVEKFGLTEKQVKDACKFLEKKELIVLDLRTITLANNRKLNNVLYIGLNIDKLREISILMNDSLKIIENIQENIQGDTENNGQDHTENNPGDNPENPEDNKKISTPEPTENTESEDPINNIVNRLLTKKSIGYEQYCEQPINNIVNTYTENTYTETTFTDISPSVSPEKKKTDGPTDKKTNEDFQIIFEEFKSRFGIDYLKQKYISKGELIDEVFLNILDMYTNDYTMVQKQSKPQSIIRGVLSKLTDTHLEGLILKFEEISESTTIKNTKAYIQTMIYNTALETELSTKNLVNSKFKSGMRDMYEEQKGHLSTT